MSRISSLTAGTFLLIASSAQADATCLICDTDVWVNNEIGKCFVEDMPTYVKEMDERRVEFTTVTFTLCGKNSRGLMTLPTGNGVGHRDKYILDRASLTCLYRMINEQKAKLDPFVVFRLDQVCK